MKHVLLVPHVKSIFGMHLDEKLNFKLAHVLSREFLITIYRSFFRHHIDYGDIKYGQPNNDPFCNHGRQRGGHSPPLNTALLEALLPGSGKSEPPFPSPCKTCSMMTKRLIILLNLKYFPISAFHYGSSFIFKYHNKLKLKKFVN